MTVPSKKNANVIINLERAGPGECDRQAIANWFTGAAGNAAVLEELSDASSQDVLDEVV